MARSKKIRLSRSNEVKNELLRITRSGETTIEIRRADGTTYLLTEGAAMYFKNCAFEGAKKLKFDL